VRVEGEHHAAEVTNEKLCLRRVRLPRDVNVEFLDAFAHVGT
jgi:hypothetical protein